ncbi:GMC oxidoreductase-domain-containing protein [Mycena epipterygia]|nr:GMC oxidoreductase-domain-containing protein [Mycena epipterygia]
MNSESSEYDIIFAGGGTTACVVAGRLAAADSTLRILLVDNGRLTKENPVNVQPARYMQNMLTPGAESFTSHTTNPVINLEGRSPGAFNANCVGGGGSVNAMMYNRAPASDYDDWMRLGNPGWGSEDLIPLAKKLETYQAGVINSTHGSSGPIKISYGHETKAGQDFLVAAAGFPRGRGFTEDPNDFSTCNVYGRIPKYIDAETGRRSDSAHFYVYNQAANANLRILDRARVNRVLFDANNCATGIEYQIGGRASPMLTVRASRLVVVSAGAFCSPAILERWEDAIRYLFHRLMTNEIRNRCEGAAGRTWDCSDHHLGIASYLAPDTELTLESVSQDSEGVFETQWLHDGRGLLAANGEDSAIKLRPNAQDLEQLGPVFAHRWETFFADSPDKAVLLTLPWATMSYFTMYPMSTGYVHIRSAAPFAPLEIETALLDMVEDLVLLRWGYKWSRELTRRMDSYRGECVSGHPVFPPGSQATCGMADGPVGMSTPEIQYSAADDEAIDAFHREHAHMGWHSLGTCAMKPREQSGVVDPQLSVYGVDNLKVADLSIAPLNVALIIGEKAAVLIAKELDVQGV